MQARVTFGDRHGGGPTLRHGRRAPGPTRHTPDADGFRCEHVLNATKRPLGR